MGKGNFKQILSWGWKGIEVWNFLSALGVASMLRAISRGIVGGWVWYDQLFLFGGAFLLILGILIFVFRVRKRPGVKKEVGKEQESLDWLKNVLSTNQKHIYEAVKGHIARWDFSGLKIVESPYFQVHFQLFNMSIFALDFQGVEGVIAVGGIKCQSMSPKANSPQKAIIQGQMFEVIVTQAVLPEMAKKILEAGTNREKLNFDLSQLRLNIETTTKGHEGLKPYVKFEPTHTPDIDTWLRLQASQKIGYWS